MITRPDELLQQIRNYFFWFIFFSQKGLKLRSINRSIVRFEGIRYHRVYVEIEHLDSQKVYAGMAEGRKLIEARVRALAEAYERICLGTFERCLNGSIDKTMPHGLGVGLTADEARLRAYSEYFEREGLSELEGNHDEAVIRQLSSPPHVFGAYLRRGTQVFSGYGPNSDQALDSARRMAARCRDYPQPIRRFEKPTSPPCEYPIKLPNSPLHCFCIGQLLPEAKTLNLEK